MERSNSMAAQRRLAALTAQVGAPDARLAPEPAAGVLSWLGGLFGGGDAEDDDVPEVADAAVVRGVVKQCFLADEEWAGLEVQADPHHEGHYYRQLVDSIDVDCDEDMMIIPPSHRGLKDMLQDPNERALMMSTVEGYEKLRAALPHAAGSLSAEAVGDLGPRPGSGENIYVDGLTQGDLCIGDIFVVDDTSTVLEVASPRRPCEKWNKVHNMAQHPHGEEDGNVRQFAITNTLGGVYFRIVSGGQISIGNTLTLAERAHPEWPCSRVGHLLYSQATVMAQGGLAETKGESFCGTEEELHELISLDKLAWFEWKQCLVARTKEMGGM